MGGKDSQKVAMVECYEKRDRDKERDGSWNEQIVCGFSSCRVAVL